jgi:hypothetical protein
VGWAQARAGQQCIPSTQRAGCLHYTLAWLRRLQNSMQINNIACYDTSWSRGTQTRARGPANLAEGEGRSLTWDRRVGSINQIPGSLNLRNCLSKRQPTILGKKATSLMCLPFTEGLWPRRSLLGRSTASMHESLSAYRLIVHFYIKRSLQPVDSGDSFLVATMLRGRLSRVGQVEWVRCNVRLCKCTSGSWDPAVWLGKH